jgi:tRNA (cytidine32/uridine32-2'-O)-methyltransferase
MKPSRKVQRGFQVHPDWISVLDSVQIILVGTTHAGNIGAVARVMKNMGLSNLTLVSSTACGPETEARPMASGAYDIVERARKTADLSKALARCVMIVGTSGRLGGKRVYARPPSDLVPELMQTARKGPVAVMFGRESSGLTNEEMKLCTHHMIVPTNGDFASMNLAQAVAVTAYEIFNVAGIPVGFQAQASEPASAESREQMYLHLEKVLLRSGFLDPGNPLRMMRDIRRIFNKADMDERDVTIIRGIFRKMDNMIRIADEKLKALQEGKR